MMLLIREDSECEEASRQALPAAGAIGSADSRNARRDAGRGRERRASEVVQCGENRRIQVSERSLEERFITFIQDFSGCHTAAIVTLQYRPRVHALTLT